MLAPRRFKVQLIRVPLVAHFSASWIVKRFHFIGN
jgi:hypothetical protein